MGIVVIGSVKFIRPPDEVPRVRIDNIFSLILRSPMPSFNTFRSRSMLLSGIAFLLGLGIYVFSSFQLHEHQQILPRLASIKAVIQSSYVDTQRDPEGDTTHYPRLSYQYAVNGQAFTSNRYYLHDYGACSYNQARNLIEQYPPGKTVTAYFDTANPKVAILNTASYPGLANMQQGGIWIMNLAPLLAGLLFVISLVYNPVIKEE